MQILGICLSETKGPYSVHMQGVPDGTVYSVLVKGGLAIMFFLLSLITSRLLTIKKGLSQNGMHPVKVN